MTNNELVIQPVTKNTHPDHDTYVHCSSNERPTWAQQYTSDSSYLKCLSLVDITPKETVISLTFTKDLETFKILGKLGEVDINLNISKSDWLVKEFYRGDFKYKVVPNNVFISGYQKKE